MQAGIHSSGWLVGDFDGIFQYASGDYMLLRTWRGFSGDENPIAGVTVHGCCLQKNIQRGQPLSHQVYILSIKIK